MQVRDVMTDNPIAISPGAPVEDAVNTMFENDIRHVPVTDGGRLIGMLSDRDVRAFLWPSENNKGDVVDHTVADAMSGGVMAVGPDDDLGEVIDILVEQRVGAVPVVDQSDGMLIGIVSYVDVLSASRELF